MSLPAAPFGRMLTAMVTPFDDDGAVDLVLIALRKVPDADGRQLA